MHSNFHFCRQLLDLVLKRIAVLERETREMKLDHRNDTSHYRRTMEVLTENRLLRDDLERITEL